MSSARIIIEPGRPLPSATKIAVIPGPFNMQRGGVLPQIEVAYETWGTLAPGKDNAILLFTGLSPSSHAAASPQDPTPGWWEYMLGPGKPLDTRTYYVICVNSLGSCFGSTGPASPDPRTGKPYRLGFPELSVEDIARAGHTVVQTLGVTCLHTVMGASLGGMSALAYALLHPEAAENLVSLSAATRATAYAIALRSLQREIIRHDPHWNSGDYEHGKEPVEGMRLARKLGLTTYRSAKEWELRFAHKRLPAELVDKKTVFEMEFEVESYLEANTRKFINDFDANCYLYLSRAMDLFDVAEHGGSIEAGLSRLRLRRALVIGVETDILFPFDQQKQLAEGLKQVIPDVTLAGLPSIHGHDAFLVDKERFGPAVGQFLSAR
jgi:homoserine O-acetyltransferase